MRNDECSVAGVALCWLQTAACGWVYAHFVTHSRHLLEKKVKRNLILVLLLISFGKNIGL
jgi:hypothetical protein